MLTFLSVVAALAACVLVIAAVLFVYGLILAAARPDPVDEAYESLPAGRPELLIDTVSGSHDQYAHMTDNVRHIVTAYCEDMWHTQPTHERENPR